MRLRDLPSVDEVVRDPRLAGGAALARRRGGADDARADARGDPRRADAGRPGRAGARRARGVRVRRACGASINATGVVVHTNLGRAPLAAAALERVRRGRRAATRTSSTTSTRGERGSRHDHVADAAAAADRRRGGARRQQQRRRRAAGAGGARRRPRGDRLARRADRDRRRLPHPGRARALGRPARRGRARRTGRAPPTTSARSGPDTALILRVHPSNFRVVGFTERPAARGARARCGAPGSPLVDDLGSGALVALGDEPAAGASLAAPARTSSASRATSCSAARRPGIVAGRADLVERLRRHPLQRALRAGQAHARGAGGDAGAAR